MSTPYRVDDPPVNPLSRTNAAQVLRGLHYVEEAAPEARGAHLYAAIRFLEQWIAAEAPQQAYLAEPVHVWIRRTGSCRPALIHRVRPHALVDLVSLDPGEGGDGPTWMRLPGVPAGTRGDIHEPYLWHRPESCGVES